MTEPVVRITPRLGDLIVNIEVSSGGLLRWDSAPPEKANALAADMVRAMKRDREWERP